jgi:hypothetical protein
LQPGTIITVPINIYSIYSGTSIFDAAPIRIQIAVSAFPSYDSSAMTICRRNHLRHHFSKKECSGLQQTCPTTLGHWIGGAMRKFSPFLQAAKVAAGNTPD